METVGRHGQTVHYQPGGALPGFHGDQRPVPPPNRPWDEVYPVVIDDPMTLGDGAGYWVHLPHDDRALVSGLGND